MTITRLPSLDSALHSGWDATYRDPWPRQLRAARRSLLTTRGYLGSLLWAMQPVPNFPMETLAIDEHARLFYNDAVFKKWSPAELTGVLYHETLHRKRHHAERFVAFNADRLSRGKRALDPLLWNLAADCEINNTIIQEAGIVLPADGAFPKQYGLPDGQTAEEYYVALEKIMPPDSPGGTIVLVGMPSSGQGKGKDKDKQNGKTPTLCGSLSVVPEPENPELEKLAEAAGAEKISKGEIEHIFDDVAEAIQQAQASRSMGSGTAHMVRWGQQREAAHYDWRRELRGEVGEVKAKMAGAARASYKRPSRRQSASPDIIFAGRVAPIPDVVIYADTSGSMGGVDGEQLQAVARQVPAIIAAAGGSGRFAAIDTVADQAQRITRNSRLDLGRGGGTDMTQAVLAADKLTPRPDICIILTDGMSPWNVNRPSKMVVIVGLIASDVTQAQYIRRSHHIPDWMKFIPIPTQ